MAYTKKVKDETVIETEAVVEEATEEVVKPVKKEKKKWKDTDVISCTSITSGSLGMMGLKSRINYSWVNRGDEVDVEYQDLVAAIRSSKSHIYKPYFIINDEEFVEQFPKLKALYNNLYSTSDLKNVITDLDPASMRLTINTLPAGAKDSIKHIVSGMISNGELDSVAKIKALDEIYGTKFMVMTELYG